MILFSLTSIMISAIIIIMAMDALYDQSNQK